jgi:hypothetical protein
MECKTKKTGEAILLRLVELPVKHVRLLRMDVETY